MKERTRLVLIVLALFVLGNEPSRALCRTGEVPGGFTNMPWMVVQASSTANCWSSVGTGHTSTTWKYEWSCKSGECRSSTQTKEYDFVGHSECETDYYCFSEIVGEEAVSLWEWELEIQNKTVFNSWRGRSCQNVPTTYKGKGNCEECLPCENTASPILVSLGDQRLELTNLDGGVAFDLDADGEIERVAWTTAGVDDGFLVLDRDGNGTIDAGNELFGDSTPQWPPGPGEERNGFRALALFDVPLNGGDGDGVISPADEIFASLRVWIDRDHDGLSSADELSPLEELAIEAIELEHREAGRVDRHGNEFRFRGSLRMIGSATRPAWDVFLRSE